MFVGSMGINNHFHGQKRQQKFALQNVIHGHHVAFG